jgi:glycosyltransferase involved in cell wall biosynthesis
MKIGVIAHLKHPIREPFAGGLEMHTYALCKKLRQRGHHVTLFAAAGSADNLGLEPICAAPDQTPATDGAFRREHRIYTALMEDLRHRDFEIIHNNALHYVPPALAGVLPMPMVTVLHTPPFWEMEGSITQNHDPNSSFIAVSAFILAQWARITPVASVIPNGVDLQTFRFVPTPDAMPYLLWSGRIVPEKGLHLAIAAARQAGLALRIAGPISDPAYFARDIAPWLDDDVRYVGHICHGDLPALLGGARAFIFSPLWEEPYGLVLAEALACGTPVAAFARGAVAEILDASCGIIVPPGDIACLAQAARDVQALRRADCRKRAETIADFDSMVVAYEHLYRRLIARGQSASSSLARPRGFADMPSPRALLDHYLAHCGAMMSDIPAALRA